MKLRVLPCLLLCLLLLSGCTAQAEPVEATFFAMDTIMTLRVYGGDQALLDRLQGEVLRLEGLWSVTDGDSEIYAANHALGSPVTVSEDTAALIFEVRGEGTRWLSQRKVGDKLDVLGPLGNGFDVSDGGRYLLVGGGIGVPPLMEYGESPRWSKVAVLGFRTGDKAFPAVVSRFEENCEQTYLCTDDGTLGRRGFVDGQVREILEKDNSFTAVLACGPKPMLKNVAAVAAQFGVPCQVSMEERMACGVGACLGCATPMADGTMKHVCKDGPVFNAEEVDWNA